MGPAVPAGLFGQRGEALGGPAQLQVGEIVFEMLVRPGYRAPSRSLRS